MGVFDDANVQINFIKAGALGFTPSTSSLSQATLQAKYALKLVCDTCSHPMSVTCCPAGP